VRVYTDQGQGISTKIRSNLDGRKYIISTAKDPRGFWQLAVFRIKFEIPYFWGWVDQFKPLRVQNTSTFEEAEKTHSEVEDLVANSPIEKWQNMTW
jgi:hypothetical protein